MSKSETHIPGRSEVLNTCNRLNPKNVSTKHFTFMYDPTVRGYRIPGRSEPERDLKVVRKLIVNLENTYAASIKNKTSTKKFQD